ncbi:unnamed protein product [Cylicocyclus nassatus]|uniref:Receptor-mediated endocytosis protein 6 n=1 Tax=Cylicocyclus nassatus TaxID=53992 RepID=A0AA36HF15_CYLNA|nr:unnamed protein product [Cylicocyclus nassatus]
MSAQSKEIVPVKEVGYRMSAILVEKCPVEAVPLSSTKRGKKTSWTRASKTNVSHPRVKPAYCRSAAVTYCSGTWRRANARYRSGCYQRGDASGYRDTMYLIENQDTEGAKTKLGQMLLKAKELLRECTGSYNFQGLPRRRDFRHPGRPRNTTKQLQKGNLRASIEHLKKRSTRNRAAKLPPAFIVEDIDEDCVIIFSTKGLCGPRKDRFMQPVRSAFPDVMDVVRAGDNVWFLCERLRVEKLLVNSEISALQDLHNEINNKFLHLGLLSWNNKQHQLLLQRLVSSHSSVSQDNTCALSSQLDLAVVEEAYRKLGHHHSSFRRFLSLLFSSPLCTAELLNATEQSQEVPCDESIQAVFGLLYGNCLFPPDEKAVLETLVCLMRVQILSHSNPRLVIRKGTAAFPRLYKLYSESLYATKIFLTAALHDSVMLVLCQDEVFLDIDPAKSPLRFPSADRVRRFGDDPTSTQYHKRVAAHRKLIVEKLVLLAHSFIKGICDAISCFPSGLIWLVQQLNTALTEVKRLPVDEAALICTDLIVTNLLCPAITNPENIGIISDTPISHIARFNLMQIGQIIQTLALSRHETPQPHFQIFMSQFKDSPICELIGTLLARSLGSLDSLFPPVLCESHRTTELLRRPYFIGSIAEVNTLASILHSNAVNKVSANELRVELNELRNRLPKSFSSNIAVDASKALTEPSSSSHPRQNAVKVLSDKVHISSSNSPPHGSYRSNAPNTEAMYPPEYFDVVVFHSEAQSDPVGLIPEEKFMERLASETVVKKSTGGQKRTRFVETGSTIESAISDRTPDNASDIEDTGEQHEVGSISSSQEAPQDRMLLLDEDGASTIPDNVSDDDENGLSIHGSPSFDGLESPFSQAPSQGLRDGHENDIGDAGATSTAAGSEIDTSHRVLPTVPVAVRKQNAEGLEEKFGKFTVPTSQQSRRDDQRSLLSDSWSTNVVPSDDEGPSLPHLPNAEVAELGAQRGRAVNRTGSLCGAGTATEDRSDTWSLDAIASDSEADGGHDRLHQIVPCVNVEPLVDVHHSNGTSEELRRQSSGSSFSCGRSEADSEVSKEDRKTTNELSEAPSSSKPKQLAAERSGPSSIRASAFSYPKRSSGAANAPDAEPFYGGSSSSSSAHRKKFSFLQQGLQKVGDKMRKAGMTGPSFRQLPHSSTISDLLSEWNTSRRENEQGSLGIPNSQTICHISDLHQPSADDILAKYQPAASTFTNDAPTSTEVTSSASESAPSEQVLAYYSSENLTECRAFLDAKRKLRLVLSSVGNAPNVPFDETCRGIRLENEREQLVLLLRTLLAEAINGREQALVAHTREVMRCLQIFDNKGIRQLLRTMKEECRKRSSYLFYLQRSRVTLLRQSAYVDKLVLRIEREKSLVEECLVEVLVRFYMENKDQQIKRFLQEFVLLNAQDEKIDCLLRTLTAMYTRLPVSSMWQNAPPHLLVYARKTIERVIMAQIHALAFYPNLDADRHRDDLFSKSLARLARSTHPDHPMLKIPTVLHGEAPWSSAQAEISVINAYKSARDKLSCVVRCCETISNLISMAPGMGAAAADDITPILVYVIIQANPPSLLSNVQYIQGFGGSLLEGAEGYWWTQFTAAIEFVKTLL